MVQNFVPVNEYGSKMHTIGQRLAEERKRLSYNQVAFGKLGGVGKGTVINWEKDLTSPPGTFLAAIAAAGADVKYIITGERTKETLEPRVQALVDNYLKSSEKDKRVIEGVASQTAQPDGIESTERKANQS